MRPLSISYFQFKLSIVSVTISPINSVITITIVYLPVGKFEETKFSAKESKRSTELC